jgi:hypothetical protein
MMVSVTGGGRGFSGESISNLFMYGRPILCTLYGAVDFLNVLKKYIMYL